MADAATSASLSGCPSTDSLNDHYSALAERWQNMTTSNCDRGGDGDQPLDPESRASRPPPSTGSSSGPLSPPSPAPDCVADRAAMDATVRTTLKRMEQLSSFLSSSEADDSFHGGGRRGACTSFGNSNRSMNILVRARVGSADGDDDSNSVRSEADESTSSLLSDDSLRREESALASGHAVDEMRREMENLEEAEDHRALLLFLPQIPSISNDDDDMDEEKDMCDAAGGTPHREVRMLNPYDASPSGVAEFPSCNTDGDDEDASSSSSSSSPSSASPFTDLLGGDSPFRSASKSLLHKFDSAAATERLFEDDDNDDASSCQLAYPEKEVPPSGWMNYMAEVAYGTHEYQVNTPPTRSKPRTRTIEGGLLVTASVSVVMAILLRTSEFFSNYNGHVTEPQFYAALAIVPPLISLVQAKLVPHRMDETTVALGVLLGGLLLERGLC